MSVWYTWDRATDEVAIAESLDRALAGNSDHIVEQETIEPFPGVRMDVSTVFLALDHRWKRDEGEPLLFETMIFGGPLDQELWRWSTPQGARAGHEEVLRLCRSLRFRLRCAWWLLRDKPERW